MPRPRVLIVCADPAIGESLATEVERAGGAAEMRAGVARDRGLSAMLPHRLVFLVSKEGDTSSPLERLLARTALDAEIAVVAPVGLEAVPAVVGEARVNHLIHPDGAAAAAGVISRKLISGDIFGVDKYLVGTRPTLVRLDDRLGRARALEAVLDLAGERRLRRSVRRRIAMACEELLMNALYDAPVGEDGRPFFAEIEPRDRIHLRSPRAVSLRFGANDTELAISVRDRYGALGKSTVISYLQKCLGAGEQIDRKTYGAGLGLYLVASSATRLAFNIAPGVATEVVCTFSAELEPFRQLSVFVHRPALELALAPPAAISEPPTLEDLSDA